jgi:L-ascorbate metabolism protein UlaG (beta-lactamase superfamily)
MAMNEALELTWYGQAMFAVSGGGVTVVVDPVPPEVGYRYDPVAADLVLITHGHFDHNYLAGVSGNPRTISASGSFDVSGLKVAGIDSFHDPNRGAERGPIVIYSWEQCGLKLAHFGDLGEEPGPDIMKRLKGLDIVMIPVGGIFTIDGEQAARFARNLAPAVVVPMHYGTRDCAIPLDPVDEFTRRFKVPSREVAERPLIVSRSSLPSSTEVWVLPYR